MSTFRTPVGPQSPKVYWRRRLLVGLGALAVIIIVILIFNRPGSGAPKTVQTNSTSHTATVPKTSASTACLPANLSLVAITDKTTYAAADSPQISMKLTNSGTAACTVNMGSTQQVLTITSGSETIWTSTDCQVTPVDSAQVIKAGASISTPAIPWNRTRSSKSTCSSTTLPPVTAGGASYHLGVALGDLKSKTTTQFLLN